MSEASANASSLRSTSTSRVRRERRAQRRAAPALGREVLVPRHDEHGGLFVEGDDRREPTHGSAARLKACPYRRRRVEDALTNVIDPELGLDFVELGLIYGIEVDGAKVHVTFTLTTPACPIGPQVAEQIEEFVGELEGVDEVTSSMVFTPPWSPDKMSEDAKFALGY